MMMELLSIGSGPRCMTGNMLAPKPVAPAQPWKARFLSVDMPMEELLQHMPVWEQPAPAVVVEVEPDSSHAAALAMNGWDPAKPEPMKSGHYLNDRELFYYTVKCIQAGGVTAAKRDGERFVELVLLLAKHFLGKIVFRSAGHMANLQEDLIQEAAAKCCMVANRFNPWAKPGVKLNKAFAYFTTVTRNKMFETLESALAGSDIYLEDLKAEHQSMGDLI